MGGAGPAGGTREPAHLCFQPAPVAEQRRGRRAHGAGCRTAGLPARRARHRLRHRPIRQREDRRNPRGGGRPVRTGQPALSAALAQWRGRVLEDLAEFEFVASFAAALIEDQVNVHIAHAEAEIACGRVNSVIGVLEGLAAEHPYREPLWAQLITAYYIAERQSDALDAYRRLKTALSDDLGIEPGPTIRALHGRILRQEVLDVKRAALTAASAAAGTLDRRTRRQAAAVARLACTVGTGLSPDRGGHQDRPACGQRRRARRRRSQPPSRRGQRHGREFRHHRSAFCQRRLRAGGRRIRGSVALADGDRIRICHHEFVFELGPEINGSEPR